MFYCSGWNGQIENDYYYYFDRISNFKLNNFIQIELNLNINLIKTSTWFLHQEFDHILVMDYLLKTGEGQNITLIE